jgi:hypothetical protein
MIFSPSDNIGDKHTSYLSFEHRISGTISSYQTLEFLSMDLSDNNNGVNDYSYDLKVDISGNGIFDYFDNGLVSTVLGQANPELTPWFKEITTSMDYRFDQYHGEIEFEAINNPLLNPPDADFDNNNAVDGHDFLTLQRNLGTGTTHAQGDANGDGTVDADDLGIWETQYGTVSPLAAVSVVPEPATCTLALAALCLAMSRRRAF